MRDLHDDGLVPGGVDEGMRSCRIMFSHTSHANTSTSGSPFCAGNDSKKLIAIPQQGQASKTLSEVGTICFITQRNRVSAIPCGDKIYCATCLSLQEIMLLSKLMCSSLLDCAPK